LGKQFFFLLFTLLNGDDLPRDCFRVIDLLHNFVELISELIGDEFGRCMDVRLEPIDFRLKGSILD
jgi:hypothetical protein